MSIAVTSWDEINQADFDAAYAVVAQIVAERHPELEIRRGVIGDIVLRLFGVLGAAGRIERDRLLRSRSLLAIGEDPALADPELVDAVLSDYMITRQEGDYAAGPLTIVLGRAVPTVIPAGFTFLSEGRAFVTETSFAGRLTSGDVVSDTDRVLVAQTDGTYTFTIEVRASEIGAGSRLRQGDELTPIRPIANVTHVYATTDFTDGRNAESTNDLYARLELGYAARTWSNTPNIQALVREQEGFSDAIVSVIGAGHPEMLRDKHGLIPMGYGNRVDIWVKHPRPPAIRSAQLTATFVEQTADGPLWEVSIPRDTLPAAYVVSGLCREGRASTATVSPQTITRQYVQQDTDPDIESALEAGFSRFQSLTVRFVDAADQGETPTTALYNVTAVLTENIDALQATLSAPTLAPPNGDLVVHGAAPCFVSVELDVDLKPSSLPESSIALEVAAYVNSTGFSGALYSTRIATAIAGLLPSNVNLQRLRLSGLIYGADGVRRLYRDREVLRVPHEPERLVTPNTVAFYLDPADVTINLVQ